MSYQGKFSQARNNESAIKPKEALDQRAAAAEAAAARKAAAAKNPAPQEPVKEAPVQEEPVKKPAPVKKAPKKKAKKKKANRNVTIIFYTIYVLLVLGICAGIWYGNNILTDWLVGYEASQPTTKADEVFAQYFGDPDWAALYAQAGLEDTLFEDADDFAAYMAQKVGTNELIFAETSAGLTGGHKYLVKLFSETIGYFTLQDQNEGTGQLPDWQLGQVSLNTSYLNSVRIQKMDGHTVYVNGVALDDSYTIQIATTLAENYLPEGTKGLRTCIQLVEGLMGTPEITITDEKGNPAQVSYDSEKNMYIEQTAANTIGDDEQAVALKAAETYALYMIEESNYVQLGKYFDSRSDIYKTITGMQLWMQGHNGYQFADKQVTEYCRYSDKLFSARVSFSLNVTRRDNTVKAYELNTTLFFKHNGSKWLVYDMTNVDVQAPIAEVRLTFKNGDSVLLTNMYENDITALVAPVVTAPEGKVFDGWYRQEIGADGSVTWVLVFSPDENGNITLPAGTTLEPMTLYALFVDAETDNGGNE